MKLLLFTLFLAVVNPAPIEEEGQDPVEVIVNGVAEGEPLEVSNIVGIQLKEVVDGQITNTNDLLHPMTALGIAEATAAAAVESQPAEEAEAKPELIETPVIGLPEIIFPLPIEIPEAPTPEISIPEPIVLPEAPVAEISIPEPIELPLPVAPEVQPSPIEQPGPEIVLPVIPDPPAPEIPVHPAPHPHPFGEIYNDGLVQVTVNTPENQGVVATLQSWVSMFINYFTGGTQTTQQIV